MSFRERSEKKLSVKTAIEFMKLTELCHMIAEENLMLRETKKEHVQALRKYLIAGFDKKQVYLPMLVANKTNDRMMQMIDGSTRAKAIYSMYVMMMQNKKQSKNEVMTKLAVYFENSSIGIQVFHNLSEGECDQLYIDFNTRGKKVALSKLIEYDSRQLHNQITNKLMETNAKLKQAGIETEKHAIIRPTNKRFLSLSQLRQIVGVFMEEDHTSSKKEPTKTYPLTEHEYVELINTWIYELFTWENPTHIGNYHITMLASFPVILSLAYYVNEGEGKKNLEERIIELKKKMQVLATIDWSPQNKCWQSFKGSYRKGTTLYFLNNDLGTMKQLINWYHQHSLEEVMFM